MLPPASKRLWISRRQVSQGAIKYRYAETSHWRFYLWDVPYCAAYCQVHTAIVWISSLLYSTTTNTCEFLFQFLFRFYGLGQTRVGVYSLFYSWCTSRPRVVRWLEFPRGVGRTLLFWKGGDYTHSLTDGHKSLSCKRSWLLGPFLASCVSRLLSCLIHVLIHAPADSSLY